MSGYPNINIEPELLKIKTRDEAIKKFELSDWETQL